MRNGSTRWFVANAYSVTMAAAICCGAVGHAHAQAPQAQAPATVAQARAVLDLETLPLMDGDKKEPERRLAALTYAVKSTTKDAFNFHRKQLLDLGWTENPNTQISDDSANATFSRNGFTASLTVYKSDGEANVMLMHSGNVDITKLPRPADSKPIYESAINAMYVTEGSVAQAREYVDAELIKQGWLPYGSAGDNNYFKRNAVLLHARVLSAPGQGGKTVVDYHAALLSADIPAIEGVEHLQYHDSTKSLSFQAKSTSDNVYKLYRKVLEPLGWKATTENPVKERNHSFLIFRNPSKEMITIDIREYTGEAQTQVKYQTAADVAAESKRAEEYAAKQKIKRENAMKARTEAKAKAAAMVPKLAIAPPQGAIEIKLDKSSFSCKVPTGQAKAALDTLRAALAKDGWKEELASIQEMAGTVALKKQDARLTLIFIDTGFLPAEFKVQAFGIELIKPEAK